MNPEAIPLENREIFKRLKNFREFYLAGGTALALQIGHRISIDFDLFTNNELQKKLLNDLEWTYKDFKIKIEVNTPEQLTVFIEKIGLTFLKYPFPLIFDLVEFQGLKMLKVPEIGSTKAYSIGRRATFKDYVDLYFILKERHSSLEEIIDISEKKYGEAFNKRLFLEQLIYFKDVSEIKIKFLKEKVNKKQLESFFKNLIKKIKI